MITADQYERNLAELEERAVAIQRDLIKRNKELQEEADIRADTMTVISFIVGTAFGLGICWGSS